MQSKADIRVRYLFISPGHNYFGHHGREPGTHPIVEVEQIECIAGQGIRGDRFFGFKENYKGQITFFAWEVFRALQRALTAEEVTPAATRRNVVTEGQDLNELIGRQFELQGVRFEGIEECRPCAWMDRAIKAGAEAWLKGRGGLRARILTSGILRRDAPSTG